MNLGELRDELSARGFDYLSAARQTTIVNFARAELDDLALWPYRLTTATGTAPLTIATLGEVESVTDTTQQMPLLRRSAPEIVHDFGDLTTVGTAAWWYVDTGPAITVFPVSGTEISVRHWAVTPDLTTDTDEPESPSRWHRVIVEIAVRMAYQDSDNHDAAAATQTQIDRDVAQMLTALMGDYGPTEVMGDGVDG